MGTSNVECERLLTDEDFRKIRKLKKRAAEEKSLAHQNKSLGPSIHMPSFNFLEEREKLKKMTNEMNKNEDSDEGMEEADDEGEIIEGSDFEGEEGLEEDGEGMDEEDIGDEEDGEMMFEEDADGDEEGDEEDEEGEEEDEEEESEVVVKGKKIEKGNKKDRRKAKDDNEEIIEEEEAGSSFFDDTESDEPFDDPRTSFLSSTAIYDPDKVKKRMTLQDIKQGKKDNRDEHLKKKLGHKIKERGRLTNVQKRKNNPFQMFIQKKRLENRLKDLKSASRKTNKKLQKGMRPRSLGKAFGRK